MSRKYVMWGTYCADVLEKRVPYRQEHLDNLKALKEAGKLITLGPTQDLTMVFGIYAADDEVSVRQTIESDPYWQHQIWTSYEVREWIQAF
jgi:uncharacterized protein YciI